MPALVNLQRSDHAVYTLKYHIVWITKYRHRKLFSEHQQRCKEILEAICKEYEWVVEVLNVSVDHVHIYLATEPTDRPCDVVAKLKAKSASILKREFPRLKVGKGRVWGRGYFISSVNDRATSAIIIRYIKNQSHEEERIARQLTLF